MVHANSNVVYFWTITSDSIAVHHRINDVINTYDY